MAMSVDGLVSGLSTTDMINQLMQVEALPQTALKNKVTAQNKAVTAYQAINTKLAALTTAAKALESDDAWNAVKASSTSDAAIVTTTSAASAGSLTFTVGQLATTHTVTYQNSVSALTDPVISGDTITVPDASGADLVVNPDGTSLQAVITAINAEPNAAYRASALQVAPGTYKLQLTAVSSGADGVFGLAGTLGEPAALGIDGLGMEEVTTAGDDATISIGSTTPITVKSPTNTFTDVMPGVNLTITKNPGAPVTVSMADDRAATTDKVQALVDAANAALKEIKTATANKIGTTAAGAVAGDSALRSLSQQILSAVATGAGSPGSLATVGITVERDGTLKFNKDTFQENYDADPVTGTRAYFADSTGVTTNGLATRLAVIGDEASDSTGTVTTLIKRRNETIAELNDQVEAWDVRLTTRRAALQRQYSALEVALGKLKEQQSWLSGQLAGLS